MKEVSQAERDGVTAIHQAIGDAFKRAKLDAKASEKESLCKSMNGNLYVKAKLPLVKLLMGGTPKTFAGDPSFDPGQWYRDSKFNGWRNPSIFADLIERMENQVEGFEWASWLQVDG